MDFDRILVSELNSAGAFEPVVADRESLLPWIKPYISAEGQFPEQMLVELRRRYQVDGILFLSLTDVHPYWPQRRGVMMHLVDTYDASVAITLSGHWNASDGMVANQARADFRSSTIASSIGDVELALHSPHYFSEFVARQLSDRFVDVARASMGLQFAPAPSRQVGKPAPPPIPERFASRFHGPGDASSSRRQPAVQLLLESTVRTGRRSRPTGGGIWFSRRIWRPAI